jgi:hypothetical protein
MVAIRESSTMRLSRLSTIQAITCLCSVASLMIESLQQNHRSNKARFISILYTPRGTPSSNTLGTRLSLRTWGRLNPRAG